MESAGIKLTEQGHGSAPSAQPKDNEYGVERVRQITSALKTETKKVRADVLANKQLVLAAADIILALDDFVDQDTIDELQTVKQVVGNQVKRESAAVSETPQEQSAVAEQAESAEQSGSAEESPQEAEHALSDYEQKTLNAILGKIRQWNARFQKKFLTRALQEVSEITDAADKLIAMKSQVREIYKNLPLKTRFAIETLTELAAVDGCSVGVKYGQEILYDDFRDGEWAEQAQKELADDPDIACLAEVYELASFVNQAC